MLLQAALLLRRGRHTVARHQLLVAALLLAAAGRGNSLPGGVECIDDLTHGEFLFHQAQYLCATNNHGSHTTL